MNFRSIKRKLISLTQGFLKDELLRNNLNIEAEIPNGLTVKIAETPAELEEVFGLVNSSNRLSPAQAQTNATLLLPNSTIIIVIWYGRIVGTLTHVLDTQIGLPVELNKNIQPLRKEGRYLGEIIGLAIDSSVAKKDFILFLMYRYLHQFTMQHLKVDTWIMTTTSQKKSFYESVLCFKEFEHCQPEPETEHTLYLDLRSFEEDLKKIYGKRRHSKNLFNLFFYADYNSVFLVPEVKYYKAWTHLHHPKVVKDFLIRKAAALEHLSPQAMTSFLNFYNAVADHQEFEIIHKYSFFQRSVERRYQVNCPAFLVCLENAKIDEAQVMNVSKNGFMVSNLNNVIHDHSYSFFIDIGPGRRVALTAKASWVNEERNHCGFQIMSTSGEAWLEFLDWLATNSNHFLDFDQRTAA